MALSWLTVLGYTATTLIALLGLSILIWMVRVRPRVPQLEDDWNSDCERTTTAEIDGDAIRFKNVRDFFWRTTRDRDESWDDTLDVRADEIKDVLVSLANDWTSAESIPDDITIVVLKRK